MTPIIDIIEEPSEEAKQRLFVTLEELQVSPQAFVDHAYGAASPEENEDVLLAFRGKPEIYSQCVARLVKNTSDFCSRHACHAKMNDEGTRARVSRGATIFIDHVTQDVGKTRDWLETHGKIPIVPYKALFSLIGKREIKRLEPLPEAIALLSQPLTVQEPPALTIDVPALLKEITFRGFDTGYEKLFNILEKLHVDVAAFINHAYGIASEEENTAVLTAFAERPIAYNNSLARTMIHIDGIYSDVRMGISARSRIKLDEKTGEESWFSFRIHQVDDFVSAHAHNAEAVKNWLSNGENIFPGARYLALDLIRSYPDEKPGLTVAPEVIEALSQPIALTAAKPDQSTVEAEVVENPGPPIG